MVQAIQLTDIRNEIQSPKNMEGKGVSSTFDFSLMNMDFEIRKTWIQGLVYHLLCACGQTITLSHLSFSIYNMKLLWELNQMRDI